MSRYDFEPMEGIGSVTFGKGKGYKLDFQVPMPVGKVWGDLAIELLDIVNKFGEQMETEGSEGAAAVAAERVRARRVRDPRIVPCSRRHLRGIGLLGGAAHQGDRYQGCPWGGQIDNRKTRAEPRSDTRSAGHGAGFGWCGGRVAAGEESALRREFAGPRGFRRGAFGTVGGRDASGVVAREASCICGARYCAEDRMTLSGGVLVRRRIGTGNLPRAPACRPSDSLTRQESDCTLHLVEDLSKNLTHELDVIFRCGFRER